MQDVAENSRAPVGLCANARRDPDAYVGIRENHVDKLKFDRLYKSVEALTDVFREQDHTDRLLVACLFEVPWEIENVIDHYRQQDESLAREISKMADKIRAAINDLLWTGLDQD